MVIIYLLKSYNNVHSCNLLLNYIDYYRLKERAIKLSQVVEIVNRLDTSTDSLTYSFLTIYQQIQSIVGPAFMNQFDYKGILESVSRLHLLVLCIDICFITNETSNK